MRSGWCVSTARRYSSVTVWIAGGGGGGGGGGARCAVSIPSVRKFTVTVMITDAGTPLTSGGVYIHCLTADVAASSSIGIDRRTRVAATEPVASMTASTITTPCTPAARASAGYSGFTSRTLVGVLICPPTRIG